MSKCRMCDKVPYYKCKKCFEVICIDCVSIHRCYRVTSFEETYMKISDLNKENKVDEVINE